MLLGRPTHPIPAAVSWSPLCFFSLPPLFPPSYPGGRARKSDGPSISTRAFSFRLFCTRSRCAFACVPGQKMPLGEQATTASGGSFVDREVSRNKRAALRAVATIEAAGRLPLGSRSRARCAELTTVSSRGARAIPYGGPSPLAPPCSDCRCFVSSLSLRASLPPVSQRCRSAPRTSGHDAPCCFFYLYDYPSLLAGCASIIWTLLAFLELHPDIQYLFEYWE